jgi:hypothetical protein
MPANKVLPLHHDGQTQVLVPSTSMHLAFESETVFGA